MKKILFIVIVLAMNTPAIGAEYFEKFDKKDWAYQAVFTGFTAADWMQTREIKNYDNIYETNHILGRHPKDTAIDLYFGTAIVAHGLVSWALPQESYLFNTKIYPRRIWQLVWIGIEMKTIQNNYQLGIRISF